MRPEGHTADAMQTDPAHHRPARAHARAVDVRGDLLLAGLLLALLLLL